MSDRSSWQETELLSILEICRKISAERNLGALLETLAREAARLLEADRASIFLLDRERCELWSEVALGTDEPLRFDARLGIAGEVAMNGTTVIVPNAYEDPRFNPSIDAMTGYRTRNILAVPLKNETGEVVGVFEVINRKKSGFSGEDARVLETLAQHAGIATETALLVGQLERRREELEAENRKLLREVRGQFSTGNILGTSPLIQCLVRQIEEIAGSNVEVLITGESGTGKELVAKAIHYSGEFSSSPFVALNCSTLPDNLVEAELFGIEKGVATGVDRRIGRFEAAHGGTLFLDEIGDLSQAAQAKILRALQERVIDRVGGRKPVPVKVRILAATNKDLEAEIAEGRFREDLFYRLNVIHIRTPALREMRGDIPLLANHFLTLACESLGRPAKRLSSQALQALGRHGWPGNVRELENEMRRLAVTVRREVVMPGDLSETVRRGDRSPVQLRDAVEELERSLIRRALASCGQNRAQAARTLGLSRQGLLNKIQRYGID
jgi:Nif-specific regulatory protein